MRLFAKLYLGGTLILSLAFLASGYLLMRYSLETSLEREKEFAVKQYQYDKFTAQSGLIANENLTEGFDGIAEDITAPAAFLDAEGEILYSEIGEIDPSILENCSEKNWGYQFVAGKETSYLLIGGIITRGEEQICFLTKSDISAVLEQHETMLRYFQSCYWITMGVGILLMARVSVFLTKPLKKMSKAANRIADGHYQERLHVSGKDEVGEMAVSFNRMAQAVEEQVRELSDAAKAKEDFVANFAHELKTPLTSVIGYADMLYQKELPREEAKKAAWYIWNEGMRLEALSLKLMELTAVEHQEFSLMWMAADELLRDTAEGLRPILQDKQIELCLQAGHAYINIDYDLLKSLLLNLMDNAVKAGCRRIELTGKQEGESYCIGVRDDGRGMPEEELSRITEAFYMVDKSRSRKQHGVGLGLALADRIARLHGGQLKFESEEGKGTLISLCLSSEKGGRQDE